MFFKQLELSLAVRRAMVVLVPVLSLIACSGDDGNDGATGVAGTPGVDGEAGTDGADGSLMAKGLMRLATVPLGAEVTGLYLTEDGDLFFNAQHPDTSNEMEDADGKLHNKGTIGVLSGVNLHQLPRNPISLPVPESDEEKQLIHSAYGTYQVIAQQDDLFTSAPEGLGAITSADGLYEFASVDMVDFNAYIPTSATTGYLFTNWEYFPGGMSRIELTKNPSTYQWEVGDAEMLDFGAYGTIANCFGSVSPWGTPLTSEEWGNAGNDTEVWNNPAPADSDLRKVRARMPLAKYIDSNVDIDDQATITTFPNTYRYHYIVEITNPTMANPVPVKHYTMGRYEHENAIVMPDQKTVYLSQDNTDGVFFKFVADVAGDLSAGILYAAKLTQDAGSNEPATTGFDIQWIELAHGDNATIEAWIAQYDAIGLDDYVDGKSSYLTDADAIAWANEDPNYPSADMVYADAETAGYEGADVYGGAVTAGAPMDNRIAFLESRRAARAKGATAEWRKFEGIYVNQKRAEEAVSGVDLIPDEVVDEAYVYFAISDIDNGMIDDEGDIQLSSRVQECGGVYRMKLEAGYDVARIEPVLMGATYRSSLDGAARCDVNALSQPDNVIVADDGRIIIGEDGGQTNNTLWMYDPSENN
ncbi:alkaline phosphatase PhoX [Marinibactrum halimedae]|uniref:DUF839 domain-containing protein n=1 Tax=Marinibactrum halimedae TaxID=1444977 RepID=A0AA37T1U4_9GAMM|nr:alkaline phosphatase PhoX [Marinibactrum halimedae]MCD9457420.1 DUF839 domain-containing protein [Marinibactrum halimedae]GLS25530.1 hypothetical protein GCM10007877_12440 [Marinibactrum halimedae]